MGGGGSKAIAKAEVSNNVISEVLTKNFMEHSTVVQMEQEIIVSGS